MDSEEKPEESEAKQDKDEKVPEMPNNNNELEFEYVIEPQQKVENIDKNELAKASLILDANDSSFKIDASSILGLTEDIVVLEDSASTE
eukprot:UN08796